jgi:hypothetical protein
MSRRYHVLLTREGGVAWAIAFGDYSRATVNEERTDYRDHDWKARDLKIITTGDTQAEIDAAVAEINRRQP